MLTLLCGLWVSWGMVGVRWHGGQSGIRGRVLALACRGQWHARGDVAVDANGVAVQEKNSVCSDS